MLKEERLPGRQACDSQSQLGLDLRQTDQLQYVLRDLHILQVCQVSQQSGSVHIIRTRHSPACSDRFSHNVCHIMGCNVLHQCDERTGHEESTSTNQHSVWSDCVRSDEKERQNENHWFH